MCSFCRLTYQQLQHHSARFSKTENTFGKPPKITIVELTSASLGGVKHAFPQYLGFHEGIYHDPNHKRLLSRGLQLAATCTSGSEEAWTKWLHEVGSDRQALIAETLSAWRSVGGRAVIQKHIDFDLCSQWLRFCDEKHDQCQRVKVTSTETLRRPRRLIDIVEGRQCWRHRR